MLGAMNTLKRGETLTLTAPEGAVKARLYGAGKESTAVVADGEVVFSAETTAQLPAGIYGVEWEVLADGKTSLPDGTRVRVVASAKVDQLAEIPQAYWSRVLAAAQQALLTAAGSTEISFSAADSNFTFEGRRELVDFINDVRRQIVGTPMSFRRLRV